MELADLLRRRRMVRSFDGTPVDLDWLEDRCADALRAPTAGNAAGVRMHVVPTELVGAYLQVATDERWREGSRRLPGLSRAAAIVLVGARVDDYLARYAEVDKADSGLASRDAWAVPYWHTDAAMATMALLLLLEEAGWQAALWGSFRHAKDVMAWAGAPEEELFATVFIGRDDGADIASISAQRATPSHRARVSRVSS